MEKLIYTAMSGAQHTLMAQQIRANNLANVNTAGFRADFERASAYALAGDGYQSRVMAREEQAGTDFRAGALMQTGRKLDVAVRGEGFITVQTADGKEAYTRAGGFVLDENGIMRTRDGRVIIGEGGPITVPPNSQILVGEDGTVSAVQTDQIPRTVQVVDRIKLVARDLLGLALDVVSRSPLPEPRFGVFRM